MRRALVAATVALVLLAPAALASWSLAAQVEGGGATTEPGDTTITGIT